MTLRRAAIFIPGMAACLVTFALTGCTSISSMRFESPGVTAPQRTINSWWYTSFKIDWPLDEEPALYTDLLIAHRIISPVLDKYKNEIALWRFHRRAARDEAGHRFSFIFYTTAANARKIYAEIDSSTVLDQLKAEGVILSVSFDDTNTIAKPGIEATSDTNWSPTLQRAWPYFIMGVSQTWLDLISRYAEDRRTKPVSVPEMRVFYQEISQEVEETWRKEGGHAFLHHLKTLFLDTVRSIFAETSK